MYIFYSRFRQNLNKALRNGSKDSSSVDLIHLLSGLFLPFSLVNCMNKRQIIYFIMVLLKSIQFFLCLMSCDNIVYLTAIMQQ